MTIVDHTRDDISLPWLVLTTLVMTYYCHDYCRPHSWWHITAITMADHTRDDILLPWQVQTTLVMTYYCHDSCRPHSWWHITAMTIADHTRDDISLPLLCCTYCRMWVMYTLILWSYLRNESCPYCTILFYFSWNELNLLLPLRKTHMPIYGTTETPFNSYEWIQTIYRVCILSLA
jgi:hypothetical protein